MAINLPIVTQFSDKGLKAAKAAFANFKTDVGNATGAMGKFKAGSNAALGAVKANAGAFALAAGTAITGFAVKAIGEFQTLALESGKFAAATGLSVQEASRWKEVGGDIGIGADSIQTALGKMNKTLGTSPELFAKLGVDVVKTDSGLTDVNGTFLAVIDRLKKIKDPAERARVAAQLLGKGWQEMARFINMGSYELEKSLASVGDAQVITPEELKKAEQFRDTVDELGDKWQAFVINAGGFAVTTLNFLSKAKGYFDDPMSGFRDIGNAVIGIFTDAPKKVEVYAKELRAAREEQDFLNQSLKELKDGGLDGFVSGFQNAAVAMASATSEWEILTGALDTSIALADVQGQLSGVEAAAAKAFATGADSDIQKYIELQLKLITGLSGIAEGMDMISSKEILLRFQTEGAQAAIDLANNLSRGGELANLNENQLLTQGGVPGTRSGQSVSTNSNITVNVQGADPQAVVRALQDYNRTAGPIPVNTRGN